MVNLRIFRYVFQSQLQKTRSHFEICDEHEYLRKESEKEIWVDEERIPKAICVDLKEYRFLDVGKIIMDYLFEIPNNTIFYYF